MNRYILTTYEHPEMNWVVLAESKEDAIEMATSIYPQWEWTTTEDLLSGVSSRQRDSNFWQVKRDGVSAVLTKEQVDEFIKDLIKKSME